MGLSLRWAALWGIQWRVHSLAWRHIDAGFIQLWIATILKTIYALMCSCEVLANWTSSPNETGPQSYRCDPCSFAHAWTPQWKLSQIQPALGDYRRRQITAASSNGEYQLRRLGLQFIDFKKQDCYPLSH
ncbi:hypothetical protein BS47DRAFT_598846 [Hydnum rufescens UP504]|uniref:Uncharacterized protein n=1 Tax=Hydnum rufescens UP504 TaxID=1448309 RepID=A0A9P6AFM4_9AGAM|nr:hypothetical protein BS47DRAFT_598846 [Hydnum rufescens UP504]